MQLGGLPHYTSDVIDPTGNLVPWEGYWAIPTLYMRRKPKKKKNYLDPVRISTTTHTVYAMQQASFP